MWKRQEIQSLSRKRSIKKNLPNTGGFSFIFDYATEFFQTTLYKLEFIFFGIMFLLVLVIFRKQSNRPLSSFPFITGRIADFSYGSYKKKKSGKFGGITTRYGYKFKLEEEIHTFNIEDLTKKESDQLRQELSVKPFVYVYYDKVRITRTGSQVLVYDIVIGKWSLERTKTKIILYWSVLLLSAFMVFIAIFRLLKDYQVLKAYEKD